MRPISSAWFSENGCGLDSWEFLPIRTVVLGFINLVLFALAFIGIWDGLVLIFSPSLGMVWNGLGLIAMGGAAVWLLIRQLKQAGTPRLKKSRPGPTFEVDDPNLPPSPTTPPLLQAIHRIRANKNRPEG